MAYTTRTYLLIAIISFSVLSLLAYIYKNDQFSKVQATFNNGMKSFSSAPNPPAQNKLPAGSNLGFIHAFIASISVIVVSEVGDKTFFIAAIMAMRHSRLTIYSGAMGALGAMTVLSALLGNIVTKFVPRIYTYYLSSVLFACFGVKMLKDGYGMSVDEGTGEYDEVQHEVEKAEAEDDLEAGAGGTVENLSKGNQPPQRRKTTLARLVTFIRRYLSPIFVQAFIMTFLAEWGDRSQITTIVLAASENLLGVIIGGTIGHGLCTGLAVVGGRFIAQKISAKTVTLIGGVVFLCFALSALFIRPEN